MGRLQPVKSLAVTINRWQIFKVFKSGETYIEKKNITKDSKIVLIFFLSLLRYYQFCDFSPIKVTEHILGPILPPVTSNDN
jgi:hypothetical protein